MTRNTPERKSGRWLMHSGISVALASVIFGSLSEIGHADEVGISYWLPGRFSSLAATPQVPGWSMAEVYYHTTVSARLAPWPQKERLRSAGFPRQLRST
jgi:hypothetical protein